MLLPLSHLSGPHTVVLKAVSRPTSTVGSIRKPSVQMPSASHPLCSPFPVQAPGDGAAAAELESPLTDLVISKGLP